MKKEHISLSENDRTYLQSLIKQSGVPVKTYRRALALLELERGRTYTDVADIVGITSQSLSTWARIYQATGLACLSDKPRPGRPINIDGRQRAKITALACSDPPPGYLFSDW
ncbi:MAG: hypothetical protein FOGNACKC_04567 [Anaerolineae bacterium]|nr:hypothetical protein [Anaerolineae bacterium]